MQMVGCLLLARHNVWVPTMELADHQLRRSNLPAMRYPPKQEGQRHLPQKNARSAGRSLWIHKAPVSQ